MPRLCEFYPGICLTTEEEERKNLSQGKKNLSQVKKNLYQSTVYILPKTPPHYKTHTNTLNVSCTISYGERNRPCLRGFKPVFINSLGCETVSWLYVFGTKPHYIGNCINPLKPKLNPICYLLALLGAHHFLHVSRIRVKLLTFRLLMSCIYIWSTHS